MIEDNSGDVRLIREILAEVPDVSFELESAGRLSTGLKCLAKKQPDIVLLDLGLPDSQGLETLSKTYTRIKAIPIVVLTGLDDEAVAIEAVHKGAQDYLIKGQIHGRTLWRIMRYAMGRKRMENELRENERRLKEAQTLGRIGNWEFAIATQKIDWSDEVYELYERDKALGPPSAEEEARYYSPEETKRLRELARIATETGQERKYDLRAKLPSGRLAFFSATMRPVVDDKGHVVKLFGTVQDITELKNAETALRQSEERYRTILEEIQEGYYELDLAGNWTFFNNAFCNNLGYSREELTGMNYHVVTFEDDVDSVSRIYEEVYQTGRTSKVFSLRTVGKDGSIRFIEASAFPLIGDKGNIIGFRGIGRDVTERERAEQRLKESEERFRSLVESTSDWIWETDGNGIYTYASPKVKEFLGYEPEEVIGKTPFYFMPTEEANRIANKFKDIAATSGPIERLENTNRHKNGHLVILETSGVPIFDSKGQLRGYRGVDRDITERKKAEKQALVNAKLASVGELIAGVAHEINNPLTAVIGYAQLLMEMENVAPDIKEDLQKIYEESQRTVRVVQNLLRFARQYKPEKNLVNINELLERTLELEAYKLSTSNIEFSTHLATDPPLILADYNQLQQVILNIVTNAQQAMAETKRRGKITLTTGVIEDYVRISIADNGRGISLENMTKIFDPFFTTKPEGIGSGLGLSVCHGIITEHGGNIYAGSTPGKGTTFTIELPIATGEQAVIREKEPAKKRI